MTNAEFTETYIPLSGEMYRVAYYVLGSEADAEDAVQDMYVKLWKSVGSLDSVRNPKAYCIRMIRNICLDRLRRARESGLDGIAERADDSDRSLSSDSRETLSCVARAIERLPDSQRRVLLMKTVDGLSYEEISGITGMNNLTLRVLLSRARNRIRQMI